MDFSMDLFDKCVDRTQTWSIKWDPDYMIERFGTADLLPFNHAEMDFECPQPIIDVLQQRSNHGIYGYTLVKPIIIMQSFNGISTVIISNFLRKKFSIQRGLFLVYGMLSNFLQM